MDADYAWRKGQDHGVTLLSVDAFMALDDQDRIAYMTALSLYSETNGVPTADVYMHAGNEMGWKMSGNISAEHLRQVFELEKKARSQAIDHQLKTEADQIFTQSLIRQMNIAGNEWMDAFKDIWGASLEETTFGERLFYYREGFLYSIRDNYTYGYYDANNFPLDHGFFQDARSFGDSVVEVLAWTEFYIGGTLAFGGNAGTAGGLAACPETVGVGCFIAGGSALVQVGGATMTVHAGSVLAYMSSRDDGGSGGRSNKSYIGQTQEQLQKSKNSFLENNKAQKLSAKTKRKDETQYFILNKIHIGWRMEMGITLYTFLQR